MLSGMVLKFGLLTALGLITLMNGLGGPINDLASQSV
jgi:hypothetical protein